jgi:hypothetical protein
MDASWAEDILTRMINYTGFSRETFEELTQTFISIYQGD